DRTLNGGRRSKIGSTTFTENRRSRNSTRHRLATIATTHQSHVLTVFRPAGAVNRRVQIDRAGSRTAFLPLRARPPFHAIQRCNCIPQWRMEYTPPDAPDATGPPKILNRKYGIVTGDAGDVPSGTPGQASCHSHR